MSIVIFSSGQSNMPTAVPYNWTPEPNLYVWNFDANGQDSSVVGTAFVPAASTGVGPALAAGNVLAKANPTKNVYVINLNRGGMGLVNWGPNPPSPPTGYNFRQAIDGNVPAALASIGRTDIDYFIWGGCESDVNSQSQTIPADFESLLMNWLATKSWYSITTPMFIFGMSPYAQSAPDNGDFLWKRYNGALRAIAAADPSTRAFISLDDFPQTLFDPGSAIPYIHRTGEGYYRSGEKLGRSILSGIHETGLAARDLEGSYTPVFSNLVNCTVTFGFADWKRVGNLIGEELRIAVTPIVAGQETSFELTVAVKAKTFPRNVSGAFSGVYGDAGIVAGVAGTQRVKVVYVPKYAGVAAATVRFQYRVNPSDTLPNSPDGTT